jgi:plasmid stability protein
MVSLSIKSVPEPVARALRQRAERNRRSLQGELLHILETAVSPRPFRAHELVARIQALGGVTTPPDGTAIIRADRDRR